MTKDNTSKAQLEVWEWKEALYEELKDIPDSKKIEFILRKTASTVERINKSIEITKQESGHK